MREGRAEPRERVEFSGCFFFDEREDLCKARPEGHA